jgi:hypothetical protein
MRIWIGALAAAPIVAIVAACGSNSDKKEPEAPPQPTVFDDTVKTIDKAKAVETLTQHRVDDLNRQIDEPADSGAAVKDDASDKH